MADWKLRVKRLGDDDGAPLDTSTLPSDVLGLLRADPEAGTVEFVVVASPDEAAAVSASPAEAPSGRLHDTERLLRDRTAELESLRHQLKQLQLDLALKNEFMLEQRSALHAAEQQVADLRAAVERVQGELARREDELRVLRAKADHLDEVTSRSAYRALERASRLLDRHRLLARLAQRVARVVAGGR